MKVLCDAHIPLRLVRFLQSRDIDAIHVNQLPNRWHTTDAEIARYADAQDYLVLTKDVDFRNAFLLRRSPRKLLRICLGNIANDQLLQLISYHLAAIEQAYIQPTCYLELGTFGLTLLTPDK